jgi:predicted RNA methylase
VGAGADFFTVNAPPADVTHIICNPPYGQNRRGELAVRFIEHALELQVPQVAMLLRADFDSAVSRQHLFRHNPVYAGKLVLLHRVKWFVGPSSPSDNHAWFLYDQAHVGAPTIRYITRREAEDMILEQPAMLGGAL